MIEWLATLQIDYEAIPIRSFVHQQFHFCVAIYELLCTLYFECAGIDEPHLCYVDLMPVHVMVAGEFAAARPKPSSSTKTLSARSKHLQAFPVGSAEAVWTSLISAVRRRAKKASMKE